MLELDQKQDEKDRKIVKPVLEVFPQLEKGLNLLDKPEKVPILQVLTAREIEGSNREAVWIDVKNQSSTYALASVSEGVMEKVRIGRAFTVFQHHNLINRLEQFISPKTRLLVLPNFSYLYLEGNENRWSSRELFEESMQKVKEIQQEKDLKVLLTLPEERSELCFKVQNFADKHIKAKRTARGIKYSSENFETLFYRDGKAFQTTIPYWKSREVEV